MTAPSSSKNLLHLYILLISSSLLASDARGSPAIGVTYHHDIPGLPGRELVVAALRSAGITHARLTDPDPATIRSFLYSGISLLLSVPDSLTHDLAVNRSAARRWISDHVLPFHPRAHIVTISVGHGVLSPSLLPAIKNLHSSCLELGLRKIHISAAFSFHVLDPALPPSAARFNESLSKPYIRPLLDFLSSTGSPILIDLFPYKLCRSDAGIPIGYALFEQEAFGFRDDPGSGLRYRNLFDAMLDAAISAVRDLGYRELPVVVAGTGWPSGGGAPEATAEYARRYNEGVVEHLRSVLGTPMRREAADAVYIWELFDDPRRRGAEWERHWGIWWANLSSKYDIVFSGLGCRGFGTAMGLGGCCWVLVFLLLRWDE